MRWISSVMITLLSLAIATAGFAQGPEHGYTIGVNDILVINILQPEELNTEVNVAPDGTIFFPYIGSVYVKGLLVTEIQKQIEGRLADGYLKYPVVSVVLKQSRSRRFFVYGEVIKPGTYPLEENTTVLRAISMASGFTKYGSSSRVKILRPKGNKAGYEPIKINVKAVMNGDADADIALQNGDIIVVSEGVF